MEAESSEGSTGRWGAGRTIALLTTVSVTIDSVEFRQLNVKYGRDSRNMWRLLGEPISALVFDDHVHCLAIQQHLDRVKHEYRSLAYRRIRVEIDGAEPAVDNPTFIVT